MQGERFEFGSKLDLGASESMIIDAFASQRRRFLEVARTLDDDEWAHPTRCSDWNAHQLVLHVVGATDACRTTLMESRSVFDGHFDPNSSPNEFVDLRSAQPVGASLEQLETSIELAIDAIEQQRSASPSLQVTAVWGEPVDWRLFLTHIFFDAWVHERDLMLPLDRAPETPEVEARLAAAYALTVAGVVAEFFGIPLNAALDLDGTGAGRYELHVDHPDVRVSVNPRARTDGVSDGDAAAVTDSMMGRDPELADVLVAPADVIDALSGVGTFLRG